MRITGISWILAASALAQAQEWKPLVDGRSLAGWELHGTASDWSVKDGVLACAATAPTWLGTADSFADYVLELEFRGTATVNSGVFLRSQKEGQPHITGYELQIWDYQPGGYNTGSLVNSVKALPVKIRGGEWNQYRITADHDRFVVVLNGVEILDARDPKHSSGVIGLQCQPNNPIEFRNLRLRPLGAAAANPWDKVKALKSGTELRIFETGKPQPVIARMDEADEERLLVVVKNEQIAVRRENIERLDYRPQGSRLRQESKTTVEDPKFDKPPVGPAGMARPSMSSTSGLTVGSKPDFEIIYQRPRRK